MTDADDATASNLFYLADIERPMLDRAEGVYLWDVEGNRYLDASSGPMVSNIGHSNRHVIDVMKRQIDKATFGYRLHFLNEPAEQLATLTASLMPDGLNRIFFTSGGSEAVESCIKLARQHAFVTGQENRWKVISLTPSYHGGTLGAVAVTGMKRFVEPFADMIKEMPKIPAATCYLDRDTLTHEERGLKYAEFLRQEIIHQGPDSVLAFIMEPVGGAATGALVAPDSYYPRIREICDEFGVLLITDEVLSGAGRTGRFLAGEHWEIKPDIVAMAKGFAAGYAPLGVMAARRDMVEALHDAGGFAHGFTYSGNPLACAAGLAVINELLDNHLIQKAETRGERLKEALCELMNRYEIIGDVRGKGLLLAFELVADRDTMEPLAAELDAHVHLVEEAYKRGLIIYSRRTRGGSLGDHFMVCPPLIITDEQIDELIDILSDSLDALAEKLSLPGRSGN